MAAEVDEVGIWYGLEQKEFEERVRSFLLVNCGWSMDEEIPSILYQVFVTRSFGNKDSGVLNNEPLVFYGNTVVSNILASKLCALGKYEPSMMSEARNYAMFPNAYVYHLFDKGMDMRPLLRITISRDKTNVDTKLNYVLARMGDAFEAMIGALDMIGKRSMAELIVQKVLLDDALVHCEELLSLGDAEMRKRWKKITFQRASRFKELADSLVI